MENSILMSNLTELVKKIIISFCKTNVQFQTRLEILGSIHVRSDNKDVVAFVLNEHCNSIGEDVANDNLFGKNANMPVNEEIKTNIKKEAQDSVEIYSDENEYDNTFTETRVKHENNFIQQPPIEEDAEAYEENDANNYYENEDEYNSYDYSSPHYSNIPKAKPKRRKPTIKNTSANNQFSDNSFYQVNSTYTCTVCGLQFKSMDGLKCHVNSKHSLQKLYQCQFCPQTFLTRQASYSHRVKFHNINRLKHAQAANGSSYLGEGE